VDEQGRRIPNSLLRIMGTAPFTECYGRGRAVELSSDPNLRLVRLRPGMDGSTCLSGMKRLDLSPTLTLANWYHNNHDGNLHGMRGRVRSRREPLCQGRGAARTMITTGGLISTFSCRDGGTNLLFHNDGPLAPSSTHWKFSESALQAGVADTSRVFPLGSLITTTTDGKTYSSPAIGSRCRRGGGGLLGLPHQAALPRLYHNNHDAPSPT